MVTLFVAHHGSLLSVWIDTRPPYVTERRPKFRAPDCYHDHVVGDTRSVLATLAGAGLLPHEAHVEPVNQEWARWGLDLVAAAKSRRRASPPGPGDGGLFDAQHVAPTMAR